MRTRLKTLAKDHLQQAFYILQGDESFADVRRLISRTLDTIDRGSPRAVTERDPSAKVVRLRPPDPMSKRASRAVRNARRIAADS